MSSGDLKERILYVNALLHVAYISCSVYIVRQINELRREGGNRTRKKKGTKYN